jgi:WhiB family redox-sensing transcriptional regulator
MRDWTVLSMDDGEDTFCRTEVMARPDLPVVPPGRLGVPVTVEPDVWREQAACRGMDPAIFFPEDTGGDPYAEARKVCASCPVQVECREYAISAYERAGMWGGWTWNRRRDARSARVERRDGARVLRCVVCGDEFTSVAAGVHKYCGPTCVQTVQRRRRKLARA